MLRIKKTDLDAHLTEGGKSVPITCWQHPTVYRRDTTAPIDERMCWERGFVKGLEKKYKKRRFFLDLKRADCKRSVHTTCAYFKILGATEDNFEEWIEKIESAGVMHYIAERNPKPIQWQLASIYKFWKICAVECANAGKEFAMMPFQKRHRD